MRERSIKAGGDLYSELFGVIRKHINEWNSDDIDPYIGIDHALTLWNIHQYSIIYDSLGKDAALEYIERDFSFLRNYFGAIYADEKYESPGVEDEAKKRSKFN